MPVPETNVYLVGAGPGDPELLTLKALRVLRNADIVFYDSLLNNEILKYLPEHCEQIFVGKRYNKPSLDQKEVNRLLYEAAQNKKTVVRLKGGDPFIFGRGGEEIEFLQNKDIPVKVLPGVTSASAASASLKAPLTHRDYGQSVILLSGYSKTAPKNSDGEEEKSLPDYDWNFLANASLTLVFYMGLKNLQAICDNLIQHGASPNKGAAIISNSSLPNEKKVITELQNLHEESQRTDIEFPAIILIGDVIKKIASKNQHLSNSKSIPVDSKINSKERLLLLLFHGARSLQNSSLPQEFVDAVREKIQHKLVSYSYLTESVSPSMKDTIDKALTQGKSKLKGVDIFPIFLLPGKHLDEDIPLEVENLERSYPELTIKLHNSPHIIYDLLPSLSQLAWNILNI